MSENLLVKNAEAIAASARLKTLMRLAEPQSKFKVKQGVINVGDGVTVTLTKGDVEALVGKGNEVTSITVENGGITGVEHKAAKPVKVSGSGSSKPVMGQPL